MITDPLKQESFSLAPEVSRQEGAVGHVQIGYKIQLRRNRSLLTILCMTLAIVAVPYGIGGPLISSIYGGGQLSLFLGLIVVLFADGCVALSLAELASRFPTSSGTYYWTYQLSGQASSRKFLSFLTGWFWLMGNWTITLSVNFGFASLVAATISIYHPEWVASPWQLLLLFYAICLVTLAICSLGNAIMPYIDIAAAIWNALTILGILIAVTTTAKAGRHAPLYGLGHYDSSLSGWDHGFTFFIGLLPPAYAFSAIGMITSMAEECKDPELEVPRAISLSIPIGGLVALLFVLPLNFTLPPLEELIDAPYGQVLPYLLTKVIGSRAGALTVMIAVLLVVLFCSISITTTASRCTWAFSRDKAVPYASLWSRTTFGQPLHALLLVTVIEMLLGLVNLGSSSTFTAFVSVGVIALAVAYFIPIALSLFHGRVLVSQARWNIGPVLGAAANIFALLWILLELLLFSMPIVLPVNAISMNYASVVLVGLAVIGVVWYGITGHRDFNGPPEEALNFSLESSP